MTRHLAAVLLAVGMTATSLAQTVTQGSTVTFSLAWSDINGTPNHILERGESVLFQLSVSFTNQNTVASFTPPVGSLSSGTIRAFGAGFLDLRGVASAAGSWDLDPAHGYGVDGVWDLVGPAGYGTPQNSGATLIDIQFGQFSPNPFFNTTNPIPNIWSGLWTPENYAPRAVSFTLGPGTHSGGFASSVLLRAGTTTAVAAFCPAILGSALIPIVPAPGSTAILAAAATLAARRSRRPLARRSP
jgi:hypothetical protein